MALGESYTDPGATASDTSYANDMQISAKGNVNVNQLGNYTLTYTAPTDAAGNIGQTITRTVIVSDIPPIDITALTLNSSNNKNSLYAKHGDTLTITLTINYTIASYTATILDMIRNLRHIPTVIQSYYQDNSSIQSNSRRMPRLVLRL